MTFKLSKGRLAAVAVVVLAVLWLARPRRPAAPAEPPKPPWSAKSTPLEEWGELDKAGWLNGRPSTVLDGGELTVWWREDGGRIYLTMRSTGTVMIDVDVNQNGDVDPNLDVSYGSYNSGGICAQYIRTPSASAECDQVRTAASVAVERDGDAYRWAWSIPKTELNTGGADALVVFQIFHEREQRSGYYPDRPFARMYRLKFSPVPPGT